MSGSVYSAGFYADRLAVPAQQDILKKTDRKQGK